MKRVFHIACLALTIVAVVAVVAPPFANAVNLLTNSGFEDADTLTGWFQDPGPVVDTGIFRSGSQSAKMFGKGSGCPIPQFDVTVLGQAVTPTPGLIYELSGYSYISIVDSIPGTDTCNKNRLIAQIAFWNAPVGGALIVTNEIVIGDGNTVKDQWNEFLISLPAPAAAQRVEALLIYLQPGCDPGAVFVDDVMLTESPPTPEPNLLANPSFDTALTGWNSFDKAFYEGRSFGRRTPNGGAKLFGPGNQPGDASGLWQGFPAVNGSEWTFEVYSMTTCGGDFDPITGTNPNFGTLKLVFYDEVGSEISNGEIVIMDNTAPLGTWTKHSLTATAPAGTDSVVAFILFVQPAPLSIGSMYVDDASLRQGTPSGVTPVSAALPFQLHQNVPNPFNPSTRIAFELSQSDAVTVIVYDAVGRKVVTLANGRMEAGPHEVTWNGRMTNGAAAASGVYYYVLETSAGQVSRNMVLLK